MNRLPKSRSGTFGKRRILHKIADGEMDKIGDTTTLLEPEMVA